MIDMIKDLGNPYEASLNNELIDRTYDKELVEYVLNVFRNLESTGFVKLLDDYTIEYDESKIDYYKYITSRKKRKKKDAKKKYHFIKDNRVFELTMRFRVEVNGVVRYVKRSILLPKRDKNNYYFLKGKRYFLIYQLVDSSTYVVKDGLVFKSLQPIPVNYRKATIKEIFSEKEYTFNVFYMKVFRRSISVLLFYFCKMGFAKTLTYYMVDRIISVISNEDLPEEPDKDCYYFNANKHVVLVVNKHFFDNFDYIKAMVGMLAECFAPKTHIEDIVTKDYWLGQLGSLYTKNTDKMMDSGKSTMRFFERLLDLTSKDVLKINQVNKISIYSIVRWMVQNFPELRQKNNLDLSTKRLRLGECIASLLSMRIGESVDFCA
jgi:hypothetical protein